LPGQLASGSGSRDDATAAPAEQTSPPVSPGDGFNLGPGQTPSPLLPSDGFSRPSRASEDHQVHENRNGQLASPPNSSLQQCDFPRDVPSSQSYVDFRPGIVVDEFTALRNLSSSSSFNSYAPERYNTIASPLLDQSMFSDPANLSNDVFLPGSTYEALHTALRNHQLSTTRSGIPSCRGSPEPTPGVCFSTPANEDNSAGRSDEFCHRPRMEKYFQISPERENVLWQNYLNEICLWVSSSMTPCRPYGSD
jgi:hypothetical protein